MTNRTDSFGGHGRRIHQGLRGVFAGSGGLINHPSVAPEVLRLTGKHDGPPGDISVVYLGTASYDLEEKRRVQTSWYVDRGCDVVSLDVVSEAPETSYMKRLIGGADIVIVSGGNTDFAMRRWKHLGIDEMLRDACLGVRKCVMAGGSAGAICWWTGGHSDSIDPNSFKEAKLSGDLGGDIDDDAHPQAGAEREGYHEVNKWEYMRVDALDFIPGLCCPHHDRVQSNGVLRANDFDEMLLRHPTEVGICIDHNAAFVVDGPTYSVISPEGKEGSVLEDETFSPDRLGKPGVWIKEVIEDGETVRSVLCPEEGEISDLLVIPDVVKQSLRHVQQARWLNPDNGPMRKSYPGFESKSFFGGRIAKETKRMVENIKNIGK